MSKPLLALCKTVQPVMRDGYAGSYAHIYLPFYGYWFASGAQYAFPASSVPQNKQMTLGGSVQKDTFVKDCCDCSSTGTTSLAPE